MRNEKHEINVSGFGGISVVVTSFSFSLVLSINRDSGKVLENVVVTY